MKLIVLDIYKQNHSGKENAITRKSFCLRYLDDIIDITGKEEILEYRDYLRKKAIPLFERFNRVRDAHPELAKDVEQLELFETERRLK